MNNQDTSKQSNNLIVIDSITDSIYHELFIGEAFSSGFAYIEPYCVDRNIMNEIEKLPEYLQQIELYPTSESSYDSYSASYDSQFYTYVPSLEECSHYFFQPFSEPFQIGYKYKLDILPSEDVEGIALLYHKVSHVDYSVSDKPREYTTEEYEHAMQLIEKDKEVNLEDRTLAYITMDDTIIGAKQVCSIYLEEIDGVDHLY